jgi:SAM-dependent methyltransferase
VTSNPDTWVYGDYAPDPLKRDLPGLKAKWLLECLPAALNPLVLDYGVGEGKHLHLVRKIRPGARLVGVDVREPHTPKDFEFRKIDSTGRLPFADDTFDLVISFDVLEHAEDIKGSLDEIRRVLRPGGSFVGFVPAEGGVGPHGFFRLLNSAIYRDTKDHSHAYTRRELSDELSSRFRIVGLAYSYHFIGSALDALFFASFKLPIIGPRLEAFWRGQENAIYRAPAAQGKRSVLGSLLQLANQAAYYESTLLKKCPLAAKGLHFHVAKN